ncbi:MAG: KaiC domain-containing protein [Candidatus Asgardarchaeia archaeon]
MSEIERLKTGIPELDKILQGEIPRGFLVAAVGEPGTGKTIFSLHFIGQGLKEGQAGVYVTTEESRESIIRQAKQFKFDFEKYMEEKKLIIIDALMKPQDRWSLKSLDIDDLKNKIIEAKKELGYEHARLVIDSMSAFWLSAPATARAQSYILKKIVYSWKFTTVATSQYAITTSAAFGFGIEHIADAIIRFRRSVKKGVLKRYLLVEKCRQTDHSLNMWEIVIIDGVGMRLVRPTWLREEDISLPQDVQKRIRRIERMKEKELP